MGVGQLGGMELMESEKSGQSGIPSSFCAAVVLLDWHNTTHESSAPHASSATGTDSLAAALRDRWSHPCGKVAKHKRGDLDLLLPAAKGADKARVGALQAPDDTFSVGDVPGACTCVCVCVCVVWCGVVWCVCVCVCARARAVMVCEAKVACAQKLTKGDVAREDCTAMEGFAAAD
jgi:hypothetical protein